MLADSAYMLVFRIVHITSGVLWVGSVFLLSVFVAPAAEAIAPAGAPLMGELLGKRRLVDRIIGLGTITVVARTVPLLARLAPVPELRRLALVDGSAGRSRSGWCRR